SKYHFVLHTINYDKKEKVVEAEKDTQVFDYSKGYINLVSQVERIERETEYEDLVGIIKPKTTIIHKEVFGINEIVDKIVEAFKTRDFEAKIRFPKGEYEKENLPPKEEIKEIIVESMKRRGIKNGVLTEDNANRIFQAFQTLFRAKGSTIVLERIVSKPVKITTKSLEKESVGVGAVKHGTTVFHTENYKDECNQNLLDVLQDIIEDQHLPRSASKEINHYCFKTPVNIVLTKLEPERKFVEILTSLKLCEKIDSWVKSRDVGFYSIEYSWRKGEHPTQSGFNPDFFLKIGNNIVVVETKSDGDDSPENKAKFRWAKRHFEDLNNELEKANIDQKYFFHFLSPESYTEFAEYLADGRLLKGEFESTLEELLEKE
ncbi:restriction endonuclease subunit R, partial [Candidatus Pacearchaeota archaeon]|nr:restriction endonuclease subunit R [Candidatus Pacearchaeota archaeon]